MNLVFSRKGLDAASGGVPSPIMPDGRLCYIPIPWERERLRYGQVRWEGQNLGRIVEEITDGRLDRNSGVHLDPDIDPKALSRKAGWRGLFGQTSAAQTHLANRGVGVGDLFLFFGWFKQARLAQGRVRFEEKAPDLHVLFGWMQVGAVKKADDVPAREMRWARYHPHFGRTPDPLNTVYVASERLNLPRFRSVLPGAGIFGTMRQSLCLTAPDASRSCWRLPKWFFPSKPEQALSYHRDTARWYRCKDCVYLDTVGRGQEFVLDCNFYPQAAGWVRSLFDATVA